jgi:hypothetical protein
MSERQRRDSLPRRPEERGKALVSKDVPGGGVGKWRTGCALRGRFTAPQDEAVGIKYAELQKIAFGSTGSL